MSAVLDLPPPPPPGPIAIPGRIVLDVFEGPLDLLLHLVKINEMDIHDIEISKITSQYLEYVTILHAVASDLELVGDFMVMAATLMNIKSRSLLPRMQDETQSSPEEEIDEILSTQDLIRRLVEFRRFKELAQRLRQCEEENSRIFYRSTVVPIIPGSQTEIPRQDILTLFDTFASLLKRVRVETKHRVIEEPYSVEEKVEEIRDRLRINRQINITRLFETIASKMEAICYFLALLEMAKLREITVAQAGSFEDILVEPWDEHVGYVG